MSDNFNGLVLSKHGAELIIEDSTGQIIRCIPRKKLPSIVCGDNVIWEKVAKGQGVVTGLQTRTSLLARSIKSEIAKPFAANITKMLIVCAIKPVYDFSLIDNYLVVAELLKIEPVIVINKIDLWPEDELAELHNKFNLYEKLNYKLFFTSRFNSTSIDTLSEYLKNNISIFVGQSGVGKSSLINIILPDLNLKTRALNDSINLGKHTTSATTLYHLSQSGSIIDSPGVREFKLWKINQTDAAWSFREFRDYIDHCKFRDCSHLNEPGCAVKEAFKKNEINEKRYQSYKRIIDE